MRGHDTDSQYKSRLICKMFEKRDYKDLTLQNNDEDKA